LNLVLSPDPNICSKINLLNTETPFMQALNLLPIPSVLLEFDSHTLSTNFYKFKDKGQENLEVITRGEMCFKLEMIHLTVNTVVLDAKRY